MPCGFGPLAIATALGYIDVLRGYTGEIPGYHWIAPGAHGGLPAKVRPGEKAPVHARV